MKRQPIQNNRLVRLMMALAILTLFTACAPGPQVGLDNENRVFSPAPLLPLRLAITTPLISGARGAEHEALQSWNESPGRRRLLMNCTWQGGLENLVATMVPGTGLVYLGQGRDPLAAVGPAVLAQTDSLGQVRFTLDGPSALDVARHRGWTHLIVPQKLEYFPGKEPGDLFLATPVAIVDIQEQQIVWQGIIDSRHISPGKLGPDHSRQPALTVYEETTYRFILDLVQILGRRLNPKPDSRHDLAQPCQDRPPLLHELP